MTTHLGFGHLKAWMKFNVLGLGRTVSADIFCAEITAAKSQRLWGNLNTNFDARGCLLLLNHNR
jgi:hypothetical protein